MRFFAKREVDYDFLQEVEPGDVIINTAKVLASWPPDGTMMSRIYDIPENALMLVVAKEPVKIGSFGHRRVDMCVFVEGAIWWFRKHASARRK